MILPRFRNPLVSSALVAPLSLDPLEKASAQRPLTQIYLKREQNEVESRAPHPPHLAQHANRSSPIPRAPLQKCRTVRHICVPCNYPDVVVLRRAVVIRVPRRKS